MNNLLAKSSFEALAIASAILWSAPLLADTGSAAEPSSDTDPAADDPPGITVYGRSLEQIGVAQTSSQGTVGYADL
ncbi:MAG: hypothetical protein HC870_00585 [Rhizobiales bacterium]|nr:hypothetical protein [Hyphomicrobiales bacterium]